MAADHNALRRLGQKQPSASRGDFAVGFDFTPDVIVITFFSHAIEKAYKHVDEVRK
jgi:hypothetical protein